MNESKICASVRRESTHPNSLWRYTKRQKKIAFYLSLIFAVALNISPITLSFGIDADTAINNNINSCDDGRLFIAHSQATSSPQSFAGDVNRLRRSWALENPSCYEHHFSFFANFFKQRLSKIKKHLILHIPKTGGSAFCNLAKGRADLNTTSTNNCFEKSHFYPLWCCFGFKDRPSFARTNNGCHEIAKLPSFVMNENWLDFPLCQEDRLYSITLRTTVERVMSHEAHLYRLKNAFRNRKKHILLGRLQLMENYMTWSLSSGYGLSRNSSFESSPLSMIPQSHDLALAKETLSKFDFLLEFSRDIDCDRTVFNFLGFDHYQMPSKQNTSYKLRFSEKDYLSENSFDVELFDYARKLMTEDCKFFKRLFTPP